MRRRVVVADAAAAGGGGLAGGAATWVPEELLDMGGPCFTVLTGVTVTGNISGAAAPSRMAFVHTVRNGVRVRQHALYDWQSAPNALLAALRAAIPPGPRP